MYYEAAKFPPHNICYQLQACDFKIEISFFNLSLFSIASFSLIK